MLSCLVYLHTEPRSAESYPRPFALSFEGSLEGLVVPQSPSPDLLPADHSPRTRLGTVEVSAYYPPNLFRINTCKSLSKQTTLTLFRINTYEKHRGGGDVMVNQLSASFSVPSCRRVPELSPSCSITYKLPIFYPLSFDIHASDGGV